MYLNSEDDRNIKILIVEYNSVSNMDISKKIEKMGFSALRSVSTGEAAVASVLKNIPDMVILDIMLEGEIDGIEAAERIKKVSSVPFIFVSACNDPVTIKRIKETAPYGYIPKGASYLDLYTAIKIALQRFSVEKNIRVREKIYSSAFENINDAVVGINQQGKIIFWNGGAEELFGWPAAKALNRDISILTPSFVPNEFPDIVDKIISGHKVDQFDLVCRTKAEVIKYVSISVFPLFNYTGNKKDLLGISLFFKDISKKKQLEKQINDLLDEERMKIGQDLHDNLGQYLTGILLKLKVLENSLSRYNLSKEVDLTSRISSHVKNALESTRKLSHGLILTGFKDMNLPEALNNLGNSFPNSVKFNFVCGYSGFTRGGNQSVISQLYHIAQEAVTNALKHSSCSRITINLDADETEVIMKIIDNGKGIESRKTMGLGLEIMKYRANLINGRVHVFGNKGHGTTIICRVPKGFIRLKNG